VSGEAEQFAIEFGIGFIMAEFLVADLNVQGELQLREKYSYAALEQIPGAAQIIAGCSAALWRSPELFETSLTGSLSKLILRWSASARTAGIMTIRHDTELMSLSLLATGIEPQTDAITISTFQDRIVHELHDTGVEPAFALLELKDRPLVATINFRLPSSPDDQRAVALADRCFAAAYFRYHRLA
jgi:hypothetical protein